MILFKLCQLELILQSDSADITARIQSKKLLTAQPGNMSYENFFSTFVSRKGMSVIDTCKIILLYTCINRQDILWYTVVNLTTVQILYNNSKMLPPITGFQLVLFPLISTFTGSPFFIELPLFLI